MQAPIFNEPLRQMRRERYLKGQESSHFFYQQSAEDLIDRLKDIRRPFKRIAIIGVTDTILLDYFLNNKAVEHITLMDHSEQLLEKFKEDKRISLHIIEKEQIFLEKEHYDLLISNLYLGAINALPLCLKMLHSALEPDGFFLASFLGPQSFEQLRLSFLEAEISSRKAITAHIAPLIAIDAAGDLLQKIGFQLPVIDRDFLEIHYKNLDNLFKDLRESGETNALLAQFKGLMGKQFFLEVKKIYKEKFYNRIYPLSIELITLSAWKAHPSQQQPLKRGSGQVAFDIGLQELSKKGS